MKPVEQRFMAVFDERGDSVQKGDCLTACVAALFEVPIDEVPFFVIEKDWHGSYTRWLRDRGIVLAHPQISVDPDDPTVLRGRPSDGIYWIATVKSPRGRARCAVCRGEREALEQWLGFEERYVKYDTPQPCVNCEATGFEASLHCVVMCGGDLVWDPHPQRDMGHLGFVFGEWFVLADPMAVAA